MILKQIEREKQDFENKEIEVVPGLYFNQKDVIETSYFYINSRYKTGDIDVDGNKKYFFNIVRNPCKVFTKSIDFDTKNINTQTAGGGNTLTTWFFERDLKFWFKDKNYGHILNSIFNDLPIFGSAVVKMVKGEPKMVDLRNFIVDQSADDLDRANYIIEIHNFTPVEFRQTGKKLGWDNVDEVLKEFRESPQTHIKVYERYGEVEEENNEYRRIVIADIGKDQINERTGEVIKQKEGRLLSNHKVDRHPYWEFHAEKIPGRWLGVGVVEILRDPQIRFNELSNELARSTYYASIRTFQTRDEGVNINFNTDVVDGQVIHSEDPISQIDMSDRNLAFFNQEFQRWLQNRDENTFSYDVVQGERLPAGTPLGSARIAAAMAGSYFGQLQENVALSVKEFLYKTVIPNFLKENSNEHYIRLVGEDLDKVNQMIINQKSFEEVIKLALSRKSFPSKVQFDAIKAGITDQTKRLREKSVKISKDTYKNIKYKIDIIITGEQKDVNAMANDMVFILQAITSDPTLLTDPRKKKMLYKIMEARGLNPSDFEPEVEEQPQSILQQSLGKGAGGGVSRPTPVPMGATPERTL